MIRCLADEDFNHDILRGLVRRVTQLDIVRVQDIGLRGVDDDTVLAAAATPLFASASGRILYEFSTGALSGSTRASNFGTKTDRSRPSSARFQPRNR